MGHSGWRAVGARPRPWLAAAAGGASLAMVLAASGCSYAYEDGLPPLGARSEAATAAAEAAASAAAASEAAADQRRSARAVERARSMRLDQLLMGRTLAAWAGAMLPDEDGMTLASGSGAVTPGTGSHVERIEVGAGTASVRFACRGVGEASLKVTVGDAAVVQLPFTCNRAWTRLITVAQPTTVEIAFSSAGQAQANVAYRLTRP